MNKILQLFDEKFVINLFRQKILPYYPEFIDIKQIKIKPYKNLVWKTTYHVVLSFDTYFLKADGEESRVLIVCSAHNEEPRKNIYLALKYLWTAGLPDKFIDLPKPLFYSTEFNGTFYQGLEGENLLYYIKNKDLFLVSEIVSEAAKLFARLHALENMGEANFNFENSRIKTVIPGTTRIFQEMERRYHNKYNNDLTKIYDHLIKQEEAYFAQGRPPVLIHGDAHAENIIRTAPHRLGLIDFNDLCLGDRARDLGSFIQQLEYNIRVTDPIWSDRMKELFLSVYLQEANLKLDTDLKARIQLYCNWTAIRTGIYWFLKSGHDEDKAISLLQEVKNDLKL